MQRNTIIVCLVWVVAWGFGCGWAKSATQGSASEVGKSCSAAKADALSGRPKVVYPPLTFRGIISGQPAYSSNRPEWDQKLSDWRQEGYNVLVWLNQSKYVLPYEEFPEAREQELEKINEVIADTRWVLGRAKALGMRTFFYTTEIHYTKAFAKAHGLDKPLPVSTTVNISQNHGPDGWSASGVRDALTRAYTEAMYAEWCRTYPDLDGFYGPMGETIPGKRSSWYKEAIVPGLKRSGRQPYFIVHQWQTPLNEYLEDIVGAYENTWLALHGYNSEQITGVEPYPYVVYWAKQTGLPTVTTVYAANVYNFPFNSPRFAYEIVTEMKRIPNFQGFVFWEWSQPELSPMFRQALARYAQSSETYSEEPWLDMLQEQFGDRAAAHFLEAYNVSAWIIPETCALVWCGHDNYRRELRIPYEFLTGYDRVYSRNTSRARGIPLVAVWDYAKWVAKEPDQYKDNNGTSYDRGKPAMWDNYRQINVWSTEGGSVYEVIPPVHMANVRAMGEKCLAAAELGLAHAKKNRAQAEQVRNWMKAYQLLARYYERKVLAAVAALIYKDNHKPEDCAEAERLADEAVKALETAGSFMHEKLDPVMTKLRGGPIRQLVSNKDLLQLIAEEKEERQRLAQIFHWPQSK